LSGARVKTRRLHSSMLRRSISHRRPLKYLLTKTRLEVRQPDRAGDLASGAHSGTCPAVRSNAWTGDKDRNGRCCRHARVLGPADAGRPNRRGTRVAVGAAHPRLQPRDRGEAVQVARPPGTRTIRRRRAFSPRWEACAGDRAAQAVDRARSHGRRRAPRSRTGLLRRGSARIGA
jgi:hypothetical protein